MKNNDESKWPYELFGIECDKGWESLYQPIIQYVNDYNENHEDKIEIHQIKEKFGGLRIYVDNAPAELKTMIEEAEALSFSTCEKCGSTKNVGTFGKSWYRTLCKKCAQEAVNQLKTPTPFRITLTLKPTK